MIDGKVVSEGEGGVDPTERSDVRKEVRQSDDGRYRRLLDLALVPIAIHAAGVVVYINPVGVALIGASSADQIVGRSILSFVPPAEQARILQRAQEIQVEGKGTEPIIEKVRRLDGQEIEVEAIAVPTMYEGHAATEVILRDVTAQRQTVEALRREEEQLQLIVQASGLILGALEPEQVLNGILELARHHIAADGYAVWRYQSARGEWQAIASAGLSDAYRVAAIQAMNHSVAMPNTPLVVEDLDHEPLLANHREIHRLHGTAALLVVPLRIHGGVAGTLAFYYRQPHRFTDAEVHVAGALANLAGAAIGTAELYQEQARLRAEAEAAVRVQDQFLALLSHDLKNPLTAIKARTQLLQRQLNRAEQPNREQISEGLVDIANSVTRTLAVLSDLVTYGRIHAGQPDELIRQPTELVGLVKSVVRSFEPMTDRHQIVVETAVADLGARWDASRLERVLENLMTNAIKYSPNGGPIVVTIDRLDQEDGVWAILRIQDNGVGIPPDDLPFIFEPFRRGRNVAGQIDGMGLGLAGALQTVRQHGGMIEVVSEVGRGSTFTIRLPLEPKNPSAALDPGAERRSRE